MKGRNIIVLGSALMIVAILLIMVYAQPVIYPVFWGKVTLDGSPEIGGVVKAYVNVGGTYELRAQMTAVESDGEAWYSFNIPGTADDEGRAIRLNVTPSGGGSDSYLGGTDTYNSGDSTLLHLNAFTTGGQPTGCNLGAACNECINWCAKEGSGTHAVCTSPGNEGCVLNSGGGNAPPYNWACCGGIISQISVF